VLDAIKDVGPAIKGLAAREMGLQHSPGALTHGSEPASRNAMTASKAHSGDASGLSGCDANDPSVGLETCGD